MQNRQSERLVILVGKTGNGKSSTGNAILCKNAFHEKMSLNAVTEKWSMKMGTNSANIILYKVVDTPGLFDDNKTVSKRALDILQSVEKYKNPHVFLLIFSAKNRMTTDEKFTIDLLRIIFGEKIFEHAIVVFTHGDSITSDSDFKTLWTENSDFVKISKLCGNRVTRIENNQDFYKHNEGRQIIVDMIEKLSESGKRFYSYQHLATHREVIEEHSETYHGKGNIHEELSDIVERLGQKLDSNIWRTMLVGGAIIGLGGAGIGLVAGAAGANAVVATGLGATIVENAVVIGGAIVSTAWNVATKVKFWTIEEFTHSGKETYSYPYLDTHKSVIEEHVRNYEGKGNIHEEISKIVEMLGKRLDKQIWKKMLLSGLLLGSGAMGYIGYIAGAAGANAVVASGTWATVINNAATVGGAVVRTAGSLASSAATSRIGSALINNGATAGGAVVRTAWNVATKIRFW